MARYGQIRDIYPKYDAVNIYIATNWYHAPVFGPRALEFALLLVYFGVLFISPSFVPSPSPRGPRASPLQSFPPLSLSRVALSII